MDGEKIHQCFECPDGVQIFATEEDLLTHKWDVIRSGKSKSHMKCHICNMDHYTFEGLVRHYQLNHPVRQKLACPGCSASFDRVYQLMNHLESDDCPDIEASIIKKRRIHKAIESNMLAGAGPEPGIFDVGGGPPGKFGRYIGIHAGSSGSGKAAWKPAMLSDSPAGTGSSTSTNPLRTPTAVSGAHRTAKDFLRGDSKAPDLLTEDIGPLGRRPPGLSVWAGQDMLVPQQVQPVQAYPPPASLLQDTKMAGPATLPGRSPAAQHPAKHTEQMAKRAEQMAKRAEQMTKRAEQVAKLTEQEVANYFNTYHPSHPLFDVYKYQNNITGRFKCPYEMCFRMGKTFKTEDGFLGHLKSKTAHTTLRVQCPSCYAFFTSVAALTQHCESQSVRCRFRDSEEFLPFLNILTAGVADVKGRNIDLTVSYAVRPDALQ